MNRRARIRNSIVKSVSVLNEQMLRSIGPREHALYFNIRGRYRTKLVIPELDNPDLDPTIRVPVGLANVTFRMLSGSSISAIRPAGSATSPYRAPFNVGDINEDVANTGPLLSTSIAEGDNFVDVTGSAPVAGEWYFLIDFNRLERRENTSTYRPIGGELVQVNTVEQIDSSTWNVVFYQNVGREYASGSRLSNSPNGKVLQNIGIRGLKVKGIRKRSRKSLHSFARTQTFTGTLAGRIQ